MISIINQLILTGNLSNDPENFYGPEGDPVTSFSLAFKSGREKTGWIRCTCFNKTAEVAEKYLRSGARIAVVGYLQQSKWKTVSKYFFYIHDFVSTYWIKFYCLNHK